MKTKLVCILLLAWRGALPSTHAQGFLNLDFESANIPGSAQPSTQVPASAALPGWTAYFGSPIYGTQQVVWVAYDAISIGGATIAVNDANVGLGRGAVQGSFGVFLNGDFPNASGQGYSVAIGQTGQTPATAQSLTFFGSVDGSSVQIAFNGQPIPYFAIGSGANYTIYGGNISAFAGQTGQLLFTALPNNGGLLDNIQFSDQSIPEPSTLGLFALGGLLLGLRCWRKFSR